MTGWIAKLKAGPLDVTNSPQASTAPPLPRVVANSTALIGAVVRERALAQREDFNALDTKAATLLGFVGVVLALLFGNADLVAHWNAWLSAAVAALVLAAASLAFTLWVRGFVVAPSDEKLVQWLPLKAAATEQLLAVAGTQALDDNRRTMRRKGIGVRIATSFVLVAIFAAGAGLLDARTHLHEKLSPRHLIHSALSGRAVR